VAAHRRYAAKNPLCAGGNHPMLRNAVHRGNRYEVIMNTQDKPDATGPTPEANANVAPADAEPTATPAAVTGRVSNSVFKPTLNGFYAPRANS
jgi:hypothetical protein